MSDDDVWEARTQKNKKRNSLGCIFSSFQWRFKIDSGEKKKEKSNFHCLQAEWELW